MTRRRALAGGVAMLTSAGTLVVVGDPVSAEVSVDSFEVSDAEFERESVRPVLDVVAAFEYDSGDEPINALEFSLLVDGTEIASDELITDTVALDGDTTLSGNILESEQWSQSDFRVSVGESIDREIQVALEFRVVTSEGTVIVEDSAEDTATVSVSHPRKSALVATVGGVGDIRAGE